MAISSRAHSALSRPQSRTPWHLLVALAAAIGLLMLGPALEHATGRTGHTASFPEVIASETSSTQLVAQPVNPIAQAALTRTEAIDVELEPLGFTSVVQPEPELVRDTSSISTLAPAVAEVVTPVDTGPALTTIAAVEVANPIDRWATAGIMIETRGQLLDEYSLANVDAALAAIPAALLDDLGNRAFGPLHILVNAEGRTLSGNQPYRGPANFFSTNEATNELVLYPQQSVFTIVHELGHAYNLRSIDAGRYAEVLLDPEMRSFLHAAGWRVLSTEAEVMAAVDHMHVDYQYTGSFSWSRVSNDDPLEDFANSFAMYLLDPSALAQQSPERFLWMSQHIGD